MTLKILTRKEWVLQNKTMTENTESILGQKIKNTGSYEEYLDYMESVLTVTPDCRFPLYDILKED